jgi:hypothetical protein
MTTRPAVTTTTSIYDAAKIMTAAFTSPADR